MRDTLDQQAEPFHEESGVLARLENEVRLFHESAGLDRSRCQSAALFVSSIPVAPTHPSPRHVAERMLRAKRPEDLSQRPDPRRVRKYRRGDREAEGAALEMPCTVTGTAGSNPALSACKSLECRMLCRISCGWHLAFFLCQMPLYQILYQPGKLEWRVWPRGRAALAGTEGLNQRFAEALPLGVTVDGQAGEDEGRHRMPGQLSGGCRRQVLEGDRAGRQRVIPCHPISAGMVGDICPAEMALLVLADQSAQEFIERRFAAGKTRPLVLPRKLSPGASKPATYGRIKTSHDSEWFRTRLLTVTGSTACSKSQASTGLLFWLSRRICGCGSGRKCGLER